MKKNNPYATNRAGRIEAPKPTDKTNRSTTEKGGDLRTGRASGRKD